jgi:molybdate transport system substrate-binding protein
MTLSKLIRFIFAVLLAAAVTSGALMRSSGRPTSGQEITVSAAVSLKDALDEISGLYSKVRPDTTVRFNLGGSGTLQRQVEQGAPVDLFISASPDERDALGSEGLLLAGTRKELVKNSVVLIVPAGKSLAANFQDLIKPEVKLIAIGEPQTVPAGKYARETLTHFGLYERLKPKFVYGKDVRQALTYVATGNADAGIVYATDAKVSTKVKVVATAPDDSHSPVVYPIAVIKSARNSQGAKDLEGFLLGPQASAVFKKHGFAPAQP